MSIRVNHSSCTSAGKTDSSCFAIFIGLGNNGIFRLFLEIAIYSPKKQHSFRVRLNNRISFPNNRYCVLDKIAVILHPIKNGHFCALKIWKF